MREYEFWLMRPLMRYVSSRLIRYLPYTNVQSSFAQRDMEDGDVIDAHIEQVSRVTHQLYTRMVS